MRQLVAMAFLATRPFLVNHFLVSVPSATIETTSASDTNSDQHREETGGEGGGGVLSCEDLSQPRESVCAAAVVTPATVEESCQEEGGAVESTVRAREEGPLRWWLEIVGGGEVQIQYIITQ